MKVLVIPDVHLKPAMFLKADELMKQGVADRAVCLMDIPDDWNQEFNLDLYGQTYDAAIDFAKAYQYTLWAYGNHDLSYVWGVPETGYSSLALYLVRKKLEELRQVLPKENWIRYVYRIDDVIFCHGEKAHSYYFGKDAFEKLQGDNKVFVSIPDAVHTDLYDRKDIIPFDKMEEFFYANLK